MTDAREAATARHQPTVGKGECAPAAEAADLLIRKLFGAQSEKLDYEPARFLRRRLIRRKYVRRGDADAVPVIAPLPESLP